MKKKLLFFLILAVLFLACKLKLSENMGTVVLDLRDDSRALDADGIPILNNTRMSLRIRSSKGLEEKHYEPTEEKSCKESFL